MDGERPSDSSDGFPFPAVLGADGAKRAVLAMLVSDRVRTLLVRGVSGSAKTTLVRSIPSIADVRIVNVPAGTREDQVSGGLDIERTIATGARAASDGLLARAAGGILYGDDANLLDRSVLNMLLDAAAEGRALVERDGLSAEIACDAKFVATMNTLEAPMRPHTLDRFDVCVEMDPAGDADARSEVVRRSAEFSRNRERFLAGFSVECEVVRRRVLAARRRLPHVSLSEEMVGVIVELCAEVGAEGHRGDIAMANVSMALAALDGRDEVSPADLREAAQMCLGHRMSRVPQDGASGASDEGAEAPDGAPPGEAQGCGPAPDAEGEDADGAAGEDAVFAVGSGFRAIDFSGLRPSAGDGPSRGSGRREKSVGTGRTGRYVGSRIPRGDVADIAFDATLRAAAPYQRHRARPGLALAIEPEDLRQKVRERRNGVSVLFVVDSSGSMGARRRMVAVKGAVFALLGESYRRRDRVGLVSFRREGAEVLLPFTKSVDFAYRRLREMPTGGTTPLAAALLEAFSVMRRDAAANPCDIRYAVLATDGRANVSPSGGDPFAEALSAASRIGAADVAGWIVVDTGTGYPHTDNAARICERLNGVYLRLEDLSSANLARRIGSIVREGLARSCST